MSEQPKPEKDTTLDSRTLTVNGQQFLTDLPEGVEPFSEHAVDVTTSPLNPKDLDKLEVRAYEIYFAGDDQVEQYVPARSIIMRNGPKGLVVDSECFTPTFDAGSDGWTFIAGSEGLLHALGYELDGDESGSRISGIPTPGTLRSAAAEQGVEVEFFEEKEIRSPEYLETIGVGKYPVSYAYFDHDIGDDHITAFLLGGVPLKDSLRHVAQNAMKASREIQDQITAKIDYFTGLYRGAISLGPDVINGGGKTSRQWLHETGKEIGLTESEIDDMLQVGLTRAKEFAIYP